MCKLEKNLKIWENFPKFQNHNIERFKQSIAYIITSFTKILWSRILCNIYLNIYYHVSLDPMQARFNFVNLIVAQNLHKNLIIHYKTNCIQMIIYNSNALIFWVWARVFNLQIWAPHQVFLILKNWSNKVNGTQNIFKNMTIVIKMA
jgi:hypothetical protein